MTVAFISHSDCGRHDTGWGHPEHVGRLRAVTRALRSDANLFMRLLHYEGRAATSEELVLAHDPAYVSAVLNGMLGSCNIDQDTARSEGTPAAAVAAAGCLMDAVDMAVDGRATRSFCAVRPPGHHALRDRAMGFCFFGNVALAAHYARTKHRIGRVLIVDWDVHHGNGTQALVEHDSAIHFVSMHQWPWYPGSGAAADRGPHQNVWNIPLAGGLSRATYLDALRRGVDGAIRGFPPELVLISAGFDSLAGDPLGGFTLEMEDIQALTTELVALADTSAAGRVIAALEGGYAPERVGEGCVTVMRALLGKGT